MYLGKFHFGHSTHRTVLWPQWVQFVQDLIQLHKLILLCLLQILFSFSFFWVNLLTSRYRLILEHSFSFSRILEHSFSLSRPRFTTFLSLHHAPWERNTSLTFLCSCFVAPPWNRVNLLYSAPSNSTRRYCHYSYSYWRWASSILDDVTWLTSSWVTGHLLDSIASATSRHVSIIVKTRLASTSCQRLQYRQFSQPFVGNTAGLLLRIATSRSTINRYYGYLLDVWSSLIWLISIIDLYKNIHDQIVVIIFFCCIGPLLWGIVQLLQLPC